MHCVLMQIAAGAKTKMEPDPAALCGNQLTCAGPPPPPDLGLALDAACTGPGHDRVDGPRRRASISGARTVRGQRRSAPAAGGR